MFVGHSHTMDGSLSWFYNLFVLTLVIACSKFAYDLLRLLIVGRLMTAAAGADYGTIRVGRKNASDIISLDVLFLGDSLTAGVGCKTHLESICGTCALRLAQLIDVNLPANYQKGIAVHWNSLGITGYTARQVTKRLVPKLSKFDPKSSEKAIKIIVISCTVNDALWAKSASGYRRDLQILLQSVRKYGGEDAPIILMDTPPIHLFPDLPFLFKKILGWRARKMAEMGADLVKDQSMMYVADFFDAFPKDEGSVPADFFASDHFHPGPVGAKIIGEATAERIFDRALRNHPKLA